MALGCVRYRVGKSKREAVVTEGKLSPSRESDFLSTSSNNDANEPLQNARLVWFSESQEKGGNQRRIDGDVRSCGPVVVESEVIGAGVIRSMVVEPRDRRQVPFRHRVTWVGQQNGL